VKHHGRVGVNRAEVAGLVEVLGISEADAGRIVAHRNTHGPFADFEALIKVRGVDVEKLTAQRNLMTF
jgi:competence protein ComEA